MDASFFLPRFECCSPVLRRPPPPLHSDYSSSRCEANALCMNGSRRDLSDEWSFPPLSLPLSHRFLLPSSSFHLFRRSIGKFEIIAVPCELHPSVFTLFEEFGKTFSNFPRHMYVDTLWITYSQIVLQNIDYYIKINCKLGYHVCFLPFFFHRHIWRFNFSVTQWYLLRNNLFMTILNLLIIVYSC